MLTAQHLKMNLISLIFATSGVVYGITHHGHLGSLIFGSLFIGLNSLIIGRYWGQREMTNALDRATRPVATASKEN